MNDMNIMSDSKSHINKLTMLLMQENFPHEKLCEVISHIKKKNGRICYVCLSKPYAELMSILHNEKIDCQEDIFVDALSSLHYELKPISNCIFVAGLEKLDAIKIAIHKAITNKKCRTVVFDTITTLLLYQQPEEIIRFTHELITNKNQQEINKVYVATKDSGIYREESTNLIKDLYLFADKVIEI